MSHKVICPKLVGQRLNVKSVLPGNSFHNTAMHIRYSSQKPALHRTVLSVKSIFDNGREYYILKNMTILLFSVVLGPLLVDVYCSLNLENETHVYTTIHD